MLVPEAPRLGELHPVACARAMASLPHSAAAGRWPLIYVRSPPSQPIPAVTSLFPKIKAVRETSRPSCPEAATMTPNTQRTFKSDLSETAAAHPHTARDFAR